MTSFQTTVGQLGMARGVRQSRLANARAVEPTVTDRLGRRKGSLYILAELQDAPPARRQLFRQMLNVIQRVYYEAPSSVTAALQQAIGEAHRLLQEAGATGGVSCVVLRDGDVYIAQAGPALVVIAHPRVVQLFPDSPERYDLPLGGRVFPDVGLFHTPVEAGTTIVLAESGWLSQVEPRVLAGAATAPTLSGVLDVLQDLAGTSDLSALVVGLDVPVGAPAPREVEVWAEEAEEAEEELYEVEVAGREWEELPGRGVEPGRAAGEVAREIGKGLATATTRLAEGARALGERMLPEAEPVAPRRERRRVQAEESRRSRWPVIAALAIPLLVALVALAVWWQRGWELQKQFDELMGGAVAAWNAAEEAADEATARGQLHQAEERVLAALALKPGQGEALRLYEQIQEELDRVNHVVTLPMLMPLQQYSGLGRELARVLVQGQNIFVLDRGKDEVYQYQLDPELPDLAQAVGEGPLIYKGQQAGQVAVSDIADMTWLAAAGAQARNGLLVLDQSWRLFLSEMSGMWEPLRLPLTPPEQWRYPQSVETYMGNFYVLDPSRNQIFRYVPGDEGYEEPPTPYFEEDALVNLGGVADMAISSEPCGGYVYLLYRNGVLTKYARGAPEPFELQVPDKRLQDTPAFFSGPEQCHLYVADAGNNRIVELNADGGFVRQYHLAEGETLRFVRSLFVDEVKGVFYVLTGDALYRTPIP